MAKTKKKEVKEEVKQPIQTEEKKEEKKTLAKAKDSFLSFFNSAKNALAEKPISEEEENAALLCEKMHFDAKEAYKLLRTNIFFCLPDNSKCRVIGITSAIRGEGKSTAAINLAYTFAATGAKVLLIDMDMRLPSIAKKLDMKTGKGLSNYLIGEAELKDILFYYDEYRNFHIMFSGSIPPQPSELIGSDSMKELFTLLRKKYDFIIVDLPPVNIVSDALVAKEIVDGYVTVVRQDYSDKHSLAECMRQMSFLDANILGFVLTDSNGGSHYSRKYGHNYRRYYKKNYNYYKKYGYGKKYGYQKYQYQDYGYGDKKE